MNEEKEGFCLKCENQFEGDPNASLCPKCLAIEFYNMDNGDTSGYLYAQIEYYKKRCENNDRNKH